jgi:hypothetical protein
MIGQQKGSIVNVASIQAMAGMMTSVAYTATKASLLGYTLKRSLRLWPEKHPGELAVPGADPDTDSPRNRTTIITGGDAKYSAGASRTTHRSRLRGLISRLG